jgi:hypothetical protein
VNPGTLIGVSITVLTLHAAGDERVQGSFGCTASRTHSATADTLVLINGMLGEGEWAGATQTQLGRDTNLAVKRDHEFLYIALFSPLRRHTGLDLYLADADGPRIRLHVSGALGEASFLRGGWEELRWGENRQWTANMIGGVVETGVTRFLAPEAFEFQIHLDMLGAEPWRCFVHLKRPELILPEGASVDHPDSWALLAVPGPPHGEEITWRGNPPFRGGLR